MQHTPSHTHAGKIISHLCSALSPLSLESSTNVARQEENRGEEVKAIMAPPFLPPPAPEKTVRVAVVQAAPVSFDLTKSLEKLVRLTAVAAGGGGGGVADLIVFPEAFLSAYPWRYAFDATIGAREQRGREWYRKYYDSSVAIPSPETDIIAEAARAHNVYLEVGVIEKEGGTLYCTALLFGRDGSILLKHRKLIPTAAERLVWGRGAGDGLGVVQTDIGKIGTLICWENYMPAARMALYQQGVEIYIAPTADDLQMWTASTQHIAKEGRCFVVTANSMTRVSDFPPDYPPFTPEHPDRRLDGAHWEAEDIVNHGGSFVAGPLGERLTEPVWDREDIIFADLPLAAITESRLDFDPVGSYSRPDIFTLTVNTKPGGNVSFTS
ncbi:carbon-nitrogen hydrolase [Xylariaceae sp. FL0594]|nr:carbon-nitrogen hydrolase [Xylariaceae sp. FL0594]